MIIAGIDEAGRGPVLGPMVMCVAVVRKKDEEKLFELGVKDSKDLSKEKREELRPLLEQKLLEWKCVELSASELDNLMERKSLNEIEAMQASELLNGLKQKPEVVFVDSPDVPAENFAKRIKKYLSSNVKIRAEHKADSNYTIVGAASILAKVKRDNTIKVLAKKFGEIGSGYSHDQITRNFLKKWLEKNNDLPSCARKKWSTSQDALNKKHQTKLMGFSEVEQDE